MLAQLEERTKLSKDSLFRKKKELQRLITDFDEDYRRYEQVRGTVSILCVGIIMCSCFPTTSDLDLF